MKKSTVHLLTLLIAVFSIALVMSCKHEVPVPIVPCDESTVDFNRDVLPLLISKCSMCHNPSNPSDGIVLTSYESVMNSDVVEPGELEGSDLWERVTESDPSKVMPRPPAQPLSAAELDIIERWIQQGALNVTCGENCDTSSVTYSGVIRTLIQTKCQGCHTGSGAGGGWDLSTYQGVATVALNGKLMGSVQHLAGFSAMPKGGAKLPDCDIAKFRIWVSAGYPNN